MLLAAARLSNSMIFSPRNILSVLLSPAVFLFLLLMANPIASHLHVSDLWINGLRLIGMNPIYVLLEFTHLFFTLFVSFLLGHFIDRKYHQSNYYRQFFALDRRRIKSLILWAVISLLLLLFALFWVGGYLGVYFIEIECGASSQYGAGCPMTQSFNFAPLIFTILLSLYISFLITGLKAAMGIISRTSTRAV